MPPSAIDDARLMAAACCGTRRCSDARCRAPCGRSRHPALPLWQPAQAAPAPQAAAPKPNGQGGRILASPLGKAAWRSMNNIDLGICSTGSGPRGRVIKRDIEKALKDGVPQAAAAPAARPPVPMAPSDQDRSLAHVRARLLRSPAA